MSVTLPPPCIAATASPARSGDRAARVPDSLVRTGEGETKVKAIVWTGDFAGAASLVAEIDSVAAVTGSRFPPYVLLRLRPDR
ncbi:MAG: hypothetical protein ACLP5E_28270 [Streptosporangiaceae bacterium]